MRVIATFFGPYAPDALTSHVSVFFHNFKRCERLTKLATSSLGLLPEWANDDHARLEAHAGGEGRTASWRTQGGFCPGALLQLEGCQYRPSGMIFLGYGGTEKGHKAVAEPLHERPRIALDHALRQGQEDLHEAIHRL